MDASTFRDDTQTVRTDESETETTKVFRPVDPRIGHRQSLFAQARGTATAALSPKNR